MKKFSTILLLLSISGCCSANHEDSSKQEAEKKRNTFIIKWSDEGWDPVLTYIKDPRTELCFSVVRYDRSLNVSNVPCSPEVEKLITEK